MRRWLLVVRGRAPLGVPIADVAGAAAVGGFGVAGIATRGYGTGWLAGGIAVVLLAGAAAGRWPRWCRPA